MVLPSAQAARARIGRMMKLPKFLLVVIGERLFGKKG